MRLALIHNLNIGSQKIKENHFSWLMIYLKEVLRMKIISNSYTKSMKNFVL